MSSTRIRYGDEGYQQIHADWVTNGSARQFTREGSWGGALYRVRAPEGVAWDAEAYPDFYQASSLGPTVVDEETGNVTDEGWHLANQEDGFKVEVSESKDTDTTGPGLKFKVKDMPNKLSVEETV